MSERVFWMASGLLAVCPNIAASVNKSVGFYYIPLGPLSPLRIINDMVK